MTSPEREPTAASPSGDNPTASSPTLSRADVVLFWAARILSVVGMFATILAAILTGSMLVHGQPAYAVLLALLFLASAVFAFRFWLRRAATHAGIKILRWIAGVAFSGLLAAVLWLIPSSATEPSLAAMASDAQVVVSETPDQIVLTPAETHSEVGVFSSLEPAWMPAPTSQPCVCWPKTATPWSSQAAVWHRVSFHRRLQRDTRGP